MSLKYVAHGILVIAIGQLAGCSRIDDDKTSHVAGGKEKGTTVIRYASSQYQSDAGDWVRFLQCWAASVQRRAPMQRERAARFQALETTSDPLTIAPLIQALEKRLGFDLPKSYRDFVIATRGNGWLVEAHVSNDPSDDTSGRLLPLAKIDLYARVDPAGLKIWTTTGAGIQEPSDDVYYRYGYAEDWRKRQDSSKFRVRGLKEMLVVGHLSQGGVVLLNPAVTTSDGELEAWTLSFSSHAERFRSFAELMQDLAYFDADPDKAQSVFAVPNVYASSPCVSLLTTAASPKGAR